MAHFSEHKAKLLKIADDVLARECVSPGGIGSGPDFTDFDGLQDFLELAHIRSFIDEAVDLADDALRAVSQALVESHAAAAAITVDAPTDAQVADFKDKLEALHQDIQSDQQFSAALKMINGLVTAIDRQMNP